MSKKVLGIDVTVSKKNYILEEIRKYLKSDNREQITNNKEKKKPFIIYTPNPEIISYAQKDGNFKQIVNSAQINIPDGSGVIWALCRLHGLISARISGADLMVDLCKLAAKEGLTIGLIGGRGGVALATKECLLEKYPGLKIEVFEVPETIVSGITYHVLGMRNKIRNTKYLILNTKGKQDRDTDKYFGSLVEEVVNKKIDIFFVGLGCPKQEYFIDRIKYHVLSIKYDKPLVLMAVGGSFDYFSGQIPRSPYWMREKGLEWLYRLIHEPWRIHRQIRGAEFFIKVLLIR